jgi:hypothetical protein
MLCCWEISEAGSRTYSFQALLPGVLPGRTPNTTTIALIARAAKQGVPRARPGGHGVFPATQNCLPVAQLSPLFSVHLRWRLACHFLCRRTFRKPGDHHDRHAQLPNPCLYYAFCRGCRRGVSLDALAGDVRLDAAGHGPAPECADRPGPRDRTIGAGLSARALSAATSRPRRGKPRRCKSRESGRLEFFPSSDERA